MTEGALVDQITAACASLNSQGWAIQSRVWCDPGKKRCCPLMAWGMATGRFVPHARELAWGDECRAALGLPDEFVYGFMDVVDDMPYRELGKAYERGAVVATHVLGWLSEELGIVL